MNQTVTETMTMPGPEAEAPPEMSDQEAVAALVATRDSLARRFIDRDTEAQLLALTIAAKSNLTLVGAPGVAKTALVRDLGQAIAGARYFEAQLAADTPAQRVLGPYSIPDLDRGVFRVNYAGMLPDSHLGLLDEGYRANSVLLDNLLSLANSGERLLLNGPDVVQTELWALVIACNALPDPSDERIEAFRDRITLTRIVPSVRTDDGRVRILRGQLSRARGDTVSLAPIVPVSRAAVERVQALVPQVEADDAFLADALRLWRSAEEAALPVSARRFGEVIRLCQARALLAGRPACLPEDLTIAEHALWCDPDDQPTAYEVCLAFASRFAKRLAELSRAHQEMGEEYADVMGQIETIALGDDLPEELSRAAVNLNRKLKALEAKVKDDRDAAERETGSGGEFSALLERVGADARRVQERAFGIGS